VIKSWCRTVRSRSERGPGVGRSRHSKVLGTALGVLASTAALANASAEARYELVARWASPSPEALDVDANGDVYVASADASNNHVTRYTSAGRVVATWGAHGRGPGQFEHIDGIAVDEAGRVLVTDIETRIQTFDGQGTLLGVSPVVGPSGDRVGPFDIDVDVRGDSYLTHNGFAPDIPEGAMRFSADGRGLAAWGAEGAGDGQFDAPLGIASDGRGNVYVADAGNARI
jgi:tripartite motif-containing protein 71